MVLQDMAVHVQGLEQNLDIPSIVRGWRIFGSWEFDRVPEIFLTLVDQCS